MHHPLLSSCLLVSFLFGVAASNSTAQEPVDVPERPVQESGQLEAEPADFRPSLPLPPSSHLRDGPQGPGGGKMMRPRGNGERGGFARKWRNPSSEDLDRFILVAGELKPEWGTSLTELRTTDQEQFQKAVSGSRRLWHLVELHERNPNLYTLRVQEWKNGDELRSLGRAYREATEAGNETGAAQLLEDLKKLSLAHVDLQIRVRAEELAAMSEALERLRQDMLLELEQREQLADELIEKVLTPKDDRPDSSSRSNPPGDPQVNPDPQDLEAS